MSSENLEILRRGYDAFAAGDLDAVVTWIDPDVEVEIHTGRPDLPATGAFRGHAGFLENLGQLADAFEDIRAEPEEFIEAGDNIVVVVHTAGRGRGSGIPVENRVVHVWTLREGKAVRFRVYGSRSEALEAAGAGE